MKEKGLEPVATVRGGGVYLTPDYDNLPAALLPLTKLKIWCVSPLDLGPNPAQQKRPYRPWSPKIAASTTDPATWGTFDQAVAAVVEGKARAIGFNLLGTDYALIDPDRVLDPITGQPASYRGGPLVTWHQEILERAGTYAELSISGAGIHILGKFEGGDDQITKFDHTKLKMRPEAWHPDAVKDEEDALDMFARTARYCIVSGRPLPGFDRPLDINLRTMMRTLSARAQEIEREANGQRRTKAATRSRTKTKGAVVAPADTRNAFERHADAALSRFARHTQATIDDIVQNSAPEGQRSDGFWDVCQWYKKKGWSEDEVERLLDRHPKGIASNYPRQVRQQIDTIFAKLDEPSETDLEIAALVDRFNRLYWVVNEDGKAVIFEPGYDGALKRRRFNRLSVADLKLLYQNERIEVGRDLEGKPVMRKVADVWLNSQDRKQYVRGVKFDPSGRYEDGVLNLWEGLAVQPAPGDWGLLRAHIELVICGRDQVRFDYLLKWIAYLLQFPDRQGEVAVVMRGGEGSGKGTLAKALMKIIGHHALAISNVKHLIGNFNSHLRDCIFLFADEAFFAGDPRQKGVLKSLITEPYITVEGKYMNAAQAPNFLHVMMASNEDWVVPAAMDSRRFFVLDVGDNVKGDHDYFGKLLAQLDAGGYAAMLHDLLAMDLRTFNVRNVPVTTGLQKQRKLSLGTTEDWWVEVLGRGYIYRSKLGLHGRFGAWETRATTELLYLSYSEFAKSKGERRPLSREGLGRFMIGIGAKRGQWRHGLIGEHMTDIEEGGRPYRLAKPMIKDSATGYYVGTINEARADFTKATDLSFEWETDELPEIDDRGVVTNKNPATLPPLPPSRKQRASHYV